MSLCPGSVLITGANRGIGLEFVKQFLSLPSPPKFLFAACRSPDSAKIIKVLTVLKLHKQKQTTSVKMKDQTDDNDKDLQAIAAKNSAVTIIKIDLLDLSTLPASVQDVQDKLGGAGLNLLINNAGIMHPDKLDTVKPESMTEHYNVHVIGPLVTVQNYLPLLKKAGSPGSLSVNKSSIVNITSGLGSIDDNTSGGVYAYRCAKAAQNQLTKTLAVDLKKDGILCSTFNPGWVQTGLGGQSAKLTTDVSVTSMFKVMATFQSENETGKFYNWNGKIYAW